MNHTIKALSKFKETVSQFSQVEVKNRIATMYYDRCPIRFKTIADDGIYIKGSFIEGVHLPSKIEADTLPKMPKLAGTPVSFKIEQQNVQGLSELLYNKDYNISQSKTNKHAVISSGFAVATNGHVFTRRKTNISPDISFALAKDKLVLLERLSREGVLDAVLYDNYLVVTTPGETIKAIIDLPEDVDATGLFNSIKKAIDPYFAAQDVVPSEIAGGELLEAVRSFVAPVSAYKKNPPEGCHNDEFPPPDVLMLTNDIVACLPIKVKRTLSCGLLATDFPVYINMDLLLTVLNEFRGSTGKIKVCISTATAPIVLRSDNVEAIVMPMDLTKFGHTYDTVKDYKELPAITKTPKSKTTSESVAFLKAENESLRTALGAAKEQIKQLTATIASHPKMKKATLSQVRYITRSKRMTFEEAGNLNMIEASELISKIINDRLAAVRLKAEVEEWKEEEE